MSKKIILILLAICIGAFLSFITLFYLKPLKNAEDSKLTVFQTGAYSSYENALANKEKFSDAVILKDGELYRVLVGAATSEEGITKIAKVLTSKNIHYYQKSLNVSVSSNDLIYKYNMLLERATDDQVILEINKQILTKVAKI